MSIDTGIIDEVVELALENYKDVMASPYVGTDIKIDGVLTKGQVQDQERMTNTKEESTKVMTCLLDVDVKRGSYVEIKRESDGDFDLKGIVMTIPNKTSVDYYFTTLLFNNEVIRSRKVPLYNDDGDLIGYDDVSKEPIHCFVQRISASQRKFDAGIERESVNELIALKTADIQVNDLLDIGLSRYKVIDIEELEQDILKCYMTFFRG